MKSLKGRASKLRLKFWRDHTSSITKSYEHEWQRKMENLWKEQMSMVRQVNRARDDYRAARWKRHGFQQEMKRCEACLEELQFKRMRNEADVLFRSEQAQQIKQWEINMPTKDDLWKEFGTEREKWSIELQERRTAARRRTAASIGQARIDKSNRERATEKDDEIEEEEDDAGEVEDAGSDNFSDEYIHLLGFKFVDSDPDDNDEYSVIEQNGEVVKTKNSMGHVETWSYSYIKRKVQESLSSDTYPQQDSHWRTATRNANRGGSSKRQRNTIAIEIAGCSRWVHSTRWRDQ